MVKHGHTHTERERERDFNIIMKLFEKAGLKTNKTKTKCMKMPGMPAPRA